MSLPLPAAGDEAVTEEAAGGEPRCVLAPMCESANLSAAGIQGSSSCEASSGDTARGETAGTDMAKDPSRKGLTDSPRDMAKLS